MYEMNYIAVIVAAIASMALGALWYSPVLFGKQWMAMIGLSEQDMEEGKKKMGKSYAIMFIGSLVASGVLAMLADRLGKSTFNDALMFGFFVWLGFYATSTLGSVLWEGRPWKLWCINNGFNLVMLLVVSAIVVLWK